MTVERKKGRTVGSVRGHRITAAGLGGGRRPWRDDLKGREKTVNQEFTVHTVPFKTEDETEMFPHKVQEHASTRPVFPETPKEVL